MSHIITFATACALIATSGAISIAQVAPAVETEPPIVDVWPGLAPGETTTDPGHHNIDKNDNVDRFGDVTQPQLRIFRIEGKRTRPTVLVCPGGGYAILALNLEGTEIARWLNTLGYNAAVLTYRVPNKREGAFQDVERAMSLLRYRAKEWGIDKKRLGVLGFSAGGHLSARLSAGYAHRAYTPVDEADKESCRPDFTLLIYPAYLIDKDTGKPVPEVAPHAGMPPIFTTQSKDDPVRCADAYAAAVKEAGLPITCVMYETGGHGYGLRAGKDSPVHAWPDAAGQWLAEHVPTHGK